MIAECFAAVALLLDASGSALPVWRTQVEAHADALVSRSVLSALEASGGVMVSLWAIGDTPERLVPWTALRSQQDASLLAARIAALPGPTKVHQTGTGSAVAAALESFPEVEGCEQRVVDVVTDGESNIGLPPEVAREAASRQDIRINVLTVRTQNDDPVGWAREHLVTPNGFVIEVNGWEEVAMGLRRKISLEIAAR